MPREIPGWEAELGAKYDNLTTWRWFSWAHVKADWRRAVRNRRARKAMDHWDWVNDRRVT